MTIAEAKEFLKDKHHGVLVARKQDGSLQMTLVSPVLGSSGDVIITSREKTYKVKNIRRNHFWSSAMSSTVPTTSRSTARRK